MWFLVGGLFVVLAIFGIYMVNHQDKSFWDVIKSWFKK